MTQYRHLYHEHQHHHHHYHHHHHHHHNYNHKESIPETPLVPDKTLNPVDPKSINPVEPKSTDQANTSPPDTAMANHTECKREDDTKVPLQQNAIEGPKLRLNIWKFGCMAFLLEVIIGACALLVSNYMALKVLVIVEYSLLSIDCLITYLHDKFRANYNGSSASIYDAPKDIEEDEKALLPCFFINLAVLSAALLIESFWILKLLAMFKPLSVLSVRLAIYLKPELSLKRHLQHTKRKTN